MITYFAYFNLKNVFFIFEILPAPSSVCAREHVNFSCPNFIHFPLTQTMKEIKRDNLRQKSEWVISSFQTANEYWKYRHQDWDSGAINVNGNVGTDYNWASILFPDPVYHAIYITYHSGGKVLKFLTAVVCNLRRTQGFNDLLGNSVTGLQRCFMM